jgi:hypothetical protein
LDDLARDATYEIVVTPYNSQGLGPSSVPSTVYVGEAVPTGKPRDLTAEAVSPSEVRLSWKPPPQGQQNGELLGYKVRNFTFLSVLHHQPLSNLDFLRRNWPTCLGKQQRVQETSEF